MRKRQYVNDIHRNIYWHSFSPHTHLGTDFRLIVNATSLCKFMLPVTGLYLVFNVVIVYKHIIGKKADCFYNRHPEEYFFY